MSDDGMASRLNSFRALVPRYENALQQFSSSQSKFQVLETVRPNRSGPFSETSAKTLFILDSSFNPPSIAHQTLLKSVLQKSVTEQYPQPHRLLLLFSTMNADKAPSAASFPQRLAMMTMLANDLLDEVNDDSEQTLDPTPIDIGVTTAPYYTDKSKAIESQGSDQYPAKPKHVHLLGYDTITRIFTAKYYKDFDPPFSALDPYFEAKHHLRVTLRPDGDFGTVDEQRAFIKRLADGHMESDGAKRGWAQQVELVPPNPKAGVSSTKIRTAAKEGDWETVRQLCPPSIAAWLESEKLYEQDDRGSKMA